MNQLRIPRAGVLIGALAAAAVTTSLTAGAAAATEPAATGMFSYDSTANLLTYYGTGESETTWVDVSESAGTVVFRAGGPFTVAPGSDCEKDGFVVTCAGYDGRTQLRVDVELGAGVDTFTSRTPVAGVVRGNGGDDGFYRADSASRFTSSVDFHGGAGTDVVSYSALGAGVRVWVNGAGDDGRQGDTDNVGGDVEKFVGTAHTDHFYGDSSAERFLPGGGDDTVHANGGADEIIDTGGSDELHGGQGEDTIDVTGDAAVDYVFGGADSDSIRSVNGKLTVVHCGEGGASDSDRVAADIAQIDFVAGDCEDIARIRL